MVVNAFFVVPVSGPVTTFTTFVLLTQLSGVPGGETEPSGVPPTAAALNEIVPKSGTGNWLVPEPNESSQTSSANAVPPAPDFVTVKVCPLVVSETVAVVVFADVVTVARITSPGTTSLNTVVAALSTSAVACVAGLPI